MAPPVGLKPTTYRLEGGCSIQLNYRGLSGRRCRTRTAMPHPKCGVLAITLHPLYKQDTLK